MTTVYESMVMDEVIKREADSKVEWGLQHASETHPTAVLFPLDSFENRRLEQLKEKVSDLCDLQPTPAVMVRPKRREMLKELRSELASSLEDVEAELERLGGSASTVTVAKSMAAASTKKSFRGPPSTVAEE